MAAKSQKLTLIYLSILTLSASIWLIGSSSLAAQITTTNTTTITTLTNPNVSQQLSSLRYWRSLVQLNRSFTERECQMCNFSIRLINYALKTQRGSEQVYRIANNFCTLAHFQSPLVCSNVTKLFEDEVVKVLAFGLVTPSQVCGLLSNNTCGFYHSPLNHWEVDINASAILSQQELVAIRDTNINLSRNRAEANSNERDNRDKPFRIIHISDTHVDLKYQEGALVDCEEPLCCRQDSTPKNTSHIRAGQWGSYNCDLPMRTFEAALKYLNKTIALFNGPEIKYIIWTGDLKPHDVWSESKESAISTYKQVFDTIFGYLPNVRIFPSLGNHEMIPVDSFSPSNLLGIARGDSPEWVYKVLDGYWSRWLPDDTVKTIMKDGLYAVHVLPGLKIISLNTNFCHSNNFWLYINSTDPGGQLQWLVHELQMSELINERVHIIGHIPPGADDCLKVWSWNYNRILRRYASTVTGQFFGHTHMDQFEMFYNQDNNETATTSWAPISVGLIGPAVSPFTGNNPAFRVYTIDPKQGFAPVDYQQHYVNLTLANLNKNREPDWVQERPFSAMFGVKNILPESMHSLLLDLVEDLNQPVYYGAENNSTDDETASSRLVKLYRLFYSHSDAVTERDFDKMSIAERRRFICAYFTGESHNTAACTKFINTKLFY